MRRVTLLALAVVPTALLSLFGQSAQQGVTLRTTTTLVQVNVVAHDEKGRAVADLGKDEFEVLDKGKPQAIAVFLGGRGTAVQPAAPLPRGEFTNQMARGPLAPRGSAVILLDYLNTGFRNTARARDQAIKVVNRLSPGTAVAVYTLDRYGVHVRAEIGSDRETVVTAIQKAMGLPAPCHQRSLDGQPDDDLADCVTSGTSPLRGFYASATANRITDTLNNFQAIAAHMAGLPGRKALIWISAAYPLQIDERAPGQEVFPEAMGAKILFSSEVARAMKALNNADVSLYPVDSRALSTESPSGTMEDYTWPTMDFFAQRTGGLAFHGRNDLDVGIQAAAEDVQVSYTLGFYASGDNDPGGFHKLTVRCIRPGVTLRYKEGYFTDAKGAPKPAERRLAAAVALTSVIDSTAVPMQVKAAREGNNLKLIVRLDPDKLALEKTGERWRGTVSVVSRFAQEDGTQAGAGASRRIQFNLTQPTYERAQRSGLVFSRTLAIPKRAVRLRLLVQNEPSGEIGTLTIPLAEIGGN